MQCVAGRYQAHTDASSACLAFLHSEYRLEAVHQVLPTIWRNITSPFYSLNDLTLLHMWLETLMEDPMPIEPAFAVLS